MNNIDLYLNQDVLKLEEFIFLNLLYDKEYGIAQNFYKRNFIDIQHLEEKGYIKNLEHETLDFEKLVLRTKTLDIFKANRSSPKIRASLLVEAFRAIFPPGVNAEGYRYRGDKQGTENKLYMFMKKYPKYEDEEILQAARQYVNRFKPDYIRMRQAHYFIEKDKNSDLLGELENLSSTIEEVNTDINTMI